MLNLHVSVQLVEQHFDSISSGSQVHVVLQVFALEQGSSECKFALKFKVGLREGSRSSRSLTVSSMHLLDWSMAPANMNQGPFGSLWNLSQSICSTYLISLSKQGAAAPDAQENVEMNSWRLHFN